MQLQTLLVLIYIPWSKPDSPEHSAGLSQFPAGQTERQVGQPRQQQNQGEIRVKFG